MSTTVPYHLYVGIDIAAKTFTATWTGRNTPTQPPVTLPQTATGYQRLQEHLAATGAAPCTRWWYWRPPGGIGWHWRSPSIALRSR